MKSGTLSPTFCREFHISPEVIGMTQPAVEVANSAVSAMRASGRTVMAI